APGRRAQGRPPGTGILHHHRGLGVLAPRTGHADHRQPHRHDGDGRLSTPPHLLLTCRRLISYTTLRGRGTPPGVGGPPAGPTRPSRWPPGWPPRCSSSPPAPRAASPGRTPPTPSPRPSPRSP